MPNYDVLIAFFVAASVFAYMPGPSTLYAAAQTIATGKQGGLLAALGIHFGGYVHVFAAALGLAALFELVPVLYTIMKFAGAGYLVWLGTKYLFNRTPIADVSANADQTVTFWQSALVEILNPKTALFYVAFLPQFTDVGAALPLWGQLLILGTVVNLMFSSADLICVFLAEKVSALIKNSPAANKTASRIGGGVLVALGANLAMSR